LGEVFGEDEGAAREDDGAFDGVFEFADVSGPGVAAHEVEGFGGEADGFAAHFQGEFFEEGFGEEGDVAEALAEGGEDDVDDV